MAADNPT